MWTFDSAIETILNEKNYNLLMPQYQNMSDDELRRWVKEHWVEKHTHDASVCEWERLREEVFLIKEYGRARIKSTGITGEVIDIGSNNNLTLYTVEGAERVDGEWELYYCFGKDIEIID